MNRHHLLAAALCGAAALTYPSGLVGQSPSANLSLNQSAEWLGAFLPKAATFQHIVSRDHADVIYGFRVRRATLLRCELRVTGGSYVVDWDTDTHKRDSSETQGIVGGTVQLSGIDPQHLTAELAPRQSGERWEDDLWYVTLYRSDGRGQALAIAVADEEIAVRVAGVIRNAVRLCGGKPAPL
jgi:hypothetical protein